MAIYFLTFCLVILVLVVSLIYVQNQVTKNYLMEDRDAASLKNVSRDKVNIASKIMKINRIIKHPDYVSPRHYYVIALVEMQEHVIFGTLIRPACLWNSHDTSIFGNVTVSGWGEVNPACKGPPCPLPAKINISLRWPVYHLIGVTSFSYGCMRTNVPGIYVRVDSFVEWIESIVWPETK